MFFRNLLPVFFGLSLLAACQQQPKSDGEKERLASYQFKQVRLADGVPLDLSVNLRWRVEDGGAFYRQQLHPDSFQRHVMFPRCEESLRTMAHHYPSVDSIFLTQRDRFLEDVKRNLTGALGADGIAVQEVIVSELHYFRQKLLLMHC